MAENKPMIVVQGFSTTFRTGKDGKPEAVEWVTYAPAHDPTGTSNKVRIKELIPPQALRNDDEGTKLNLMHLKWNQIRPAYEAWKAGIEIPVDGTPLAAWAGVSPDQADVLRARGLKTVEALRDATDSMIAKIALPNMRALRELAGKFLEGAGRAAAAAQVQERDDKIKAMEAMMEEMVARLAAVDGGAKRGPGRPRKAGIEATEEAEAA